MDPSLLRTLESIGFDEKESRVYLALLELGQGTATEVAEKAGLKRPIVYHVVDRLKEKGYAHDVIKQGIKKFAVSEPSNIFKTVETAVDDFKFMLPVMRALQDKGREKPKIEFFEGKDAVLSVYWTYERGQDVRYVTSIDRLSGIMPHEVKMWIEHINKGAAHPDARHILPDTPQDRRWGTALKKGKQNVRFLPKGSEVEMDFAIVDDTLGITSFDPLFIVVIHSPAIARSAGQLFDLAWKQCKIRGEA